MKKEKRRIQEQLRRIKRNQEKLGQPKTPKKTPGGTRLGKNKQDLKLRLVSGEDPEGHLLANSKSSSSNIRCGACGAKGHMRTNKACPKFVASEFEQMGPTNVAMTEKDEEEMEKEVLELEENEELVNVDGTKISLSSKLLRHTDEMRKKTMQLKVPKKVRVFAARHLETKT